jgi:hypothetical protein
LRNFAKCWLGPGRSFGALTLAVLLLAACVRQCYSQTAYGGKILSGTIGGTVLNSVTHEPIGRALVYSSDQRFATFTDDHGNFELTVAVPSVAQEPEALANTRVMLQARRPGFLSDTGLQDRSFARLGQKDVTLSLVPEGLIVGQVKFPSAEAANHVRVQLYHRAVREGFAQWEQLPDVTTRADGEFRFAGLGAGEYKVFTLETTEQDPLANIPNGPLYGFPPRFFAAARDFATADTITLHAGETLTANLAPERQRYYDVRVPVISAEPGPVPGLVVSVYPQGHRGPGFTLGFNRTQHAIAGSLPDGTYTIEAVGFGSNGQSGAGTITVANGPANGPPLVLAPSAPIEINIRQEPSAADNPAPHVGIEPSPPAAYIRLRPAEEVPSRVGYQSQGEPPTLSGVRPGRYWVEVEANPGYAASVTSAGRDLLRAPLVVPYGASVPPIDVTLRHDGGEIEAIVDRNAPGTSGAVVSSRTGRGAAASFSPEENSFVYCIPLAHDGPVRWFNGRSNERYVLSPAPPGDYRVLAFDTRQEFEYRNPAAMRAYESKGQVVHVSAGQKVQVTVPLIRSE